MAEVFEVDTELDPGMEIDSPEILGLLQKGFTVILVTPMKRAHVLTLTSKQAYVSAWAQNSPQVKKSFPIDVTMIKEVKYVTITAGGKMRIE